MEYGFHVEDQKLYQADLVCIFVHHATNRFIIMQHLKSSLQTWNILLSVVKFVKSSKSSIGMAVPLMQSLP